jgi:large subunit ribosomal protein L35
MPKLKTKRGAAKRLKATGTGKLMRAGGWKQHHLECKSPKQRRRLRENILVASVDQRKMRRLVPYL